MCCRGVRDYPVVVGDADLKLKPASGVSELMSELSESVCLFVCLACLYLSVCFLPFIEE